MPDFKKHIVIGMVSLGLVYIFLVNILKKTIPPELLLPMIGVAAIYSLLPDIDQRGSKIYKFFIIGSIITVIYLYKTHQQKIALALLVLVVFVNLVNHRTIFHSLLFGAITAAPLLLIHPFVALAAFAAFVSHLIADGELSFFAERDWW